MLPPLLSSVLHNLPGVGTQLSSRLVRDSGPFGESKFLWTIYSFCTVRSMDPDLIRHQTVLASIFGQYSHQATPLAIPAKFKDKDNGLQQQISGSTLIRATPLVMSANSVRLAKGY